MENLKTFQNLLVGKMLLHMKSWYCCLFLFSKKMNFINIVLFSTAGRSSICCIFLSNYKMKKGILLFSEMKTKPQSVSWRHFFSNDLRPCTSCEVSKFDNSLIEWKPSAPLVISWCFKKVKSHRDLFFSRLNHHSANRLRIS